MEAISRGRPAAVIAEPIPANMGVVPPAPGFLEAVRDAAAEAGSLLILDEVITGFRVARGGAQELLGVEADLTVMGKVIGGGLPAAAYGGRRELMERIAPAGDVYQAGTLSGNPLAAAAGLATLRKLDGAAYLGIESDHDAARDRAAQCRRRPPRPGVSVPGLLTVFFSAAAGPRLRRRSGVRHRGLWPLLPRHARPRGLPARPPSSRPGSPRWPTTRRRSTGRSRPPRRRFSRPRPDSPL